jgi:hypothetical protein
MAYRYKLIVRALKHKMKRTAAGRRKSGGEWKLIELNAR